MNEKLDKYISSLDIEDIESNLLYLRVENKEENKDMMDFQEKLFDIKTELTLMRKNLSDNVETFTKQSIKETEKVVLENFKNMNLKYSQILENNFLKIQSSILNNISDFKSILEDMKIEMKNNFKELDEIKRKNSENFEKITIKKEEKILNSYKGKQFENTSLKLINIEEKLRNLEI